MISCKGFREHSLVALLLAGLRRIKSVSSRGSKTNLLHGIQGVKVNGSAVGLAQKNQACKQQEF
jgi:hypothetical protein